MDSNALHLAIIIGSTREGRFAPTVASWFAVQAGEQSARLRPRHAFGLGHNGFHPWPTGPPTPVHLLRHDAQR